MKKMAKGLAVFAVMLATVTAGSSVLSKEANGGWRETGNGGDAISLDFTQHGLAVAELLTKLSPNTLRGLTRESLLKAIDTTLVDSVETLTVQDDLLGQISKDAMNFPKENPPRIAVNRSAWRKMDTFERLTLALHEYAGIVGMEINTFPISAQLKLALQPKNWTKLPEPELIYERPVTGDKTGLSFESAMQICETHRQVFRDKFFFVYCEFDKKSWTEEHKVVREYTDYHFVGFRDRDENGDVTAIIESDRARRRGGEPIYREIKIPYHGVETVEKSVFGVRIMGLARLELQPWKKLVSSLELGKSRVSLTFDSEEMATLNCREDLMDHQNSPNAWKFDRAECSIFDITQTDGSKVYYFEIRTQNPYLGI